MQNSVKVPAIQFARNIHRPTVKFIKCVFILPLPIYLFHIFNMFEKFAYLICLKWCFHLGAFIFHKLRTILKVFNSIQFNILEKYSISKEWLFKFKLVKKLRHVCYLLILIGPFVESQTIIQTFQTVKKLIRKFKFERDFLWFFFE